MLRNSKMRSSGEERVVVDCAHTKSMPLKIPHAKMVKSNEKTLIPTCGDVVDIFVFCNGGGGDVCK
jgi:hypothetical protein